MTAPAHEVGQLWQSMDKRNGSVFVIIEVDATRVEVQGVGGKRKRWIKRSRLKPPAYRFLRDA